MKILLTNLNDHILFQDFDGKKLFCLLVFTKKNLGIILKAVFPRKKSFKIFFMCKYYPKILSHLSKWSFSEDGDKTEIRSFNDITLCWWWSRRIFRFWWSLFSIRLKNWDLLIKKSLSKNQNQSNSMWKMKKKLIKL